MTVRRIMGVETEYGIAVPGQPWANPIETSGIVVSRYARAHGLRATHGAWDYSDEQPLVDARGFELARELADLSQLTDEDIELWDGIINSIDELRAVASLPPIERGDPHVQRRARRHPLRDGARRVRDGPGPLVRAGRRRTAFRHPCDRAASAHPTPRSRRRCRRPSLP